MTKAGVLLPSSIASSLDFQNSSTFPYAPPVARPFKSTPDYTIIYDVEHSAQEKDNNFHEEYVQF